jgi:hypothetical protein
MQEVPISSERDTAFVVVLALDDHSRQVWMFVTIISPLDQRKKASKQDHALAWTPLSDQSTPSIYYYCTPYRGCRNNLFYLD